MNLEENLNKILSKYDKLQKKATSNDVINSPKDYAIISKEISEILPTVELIKKFKKVREEIKDSNEIIEDTKSDNEISINAIPYSDPGVPGKIACGGYKVQPAPVGPPGTKKLAIKTNTAIKNIQ